MANKCLIIGGSGFIGTRARLRLNCEVVVATYNATPFSGGVNFNIANTRLADIFLRGSHGFTHAILLQGITNIQSCFDAPDQTRHVNVVRTIESITDLIDAGVYPIFCSSDGVFSGATPCATEEYTPQPLMVYGRQKLEVENFLQRCDAAWSCLRLTKVVGSFVDRRNLLSQWLRDITDGKMIKCATDQYMTPVDVDDVVNCFNIVINNGLNGLYHISGSQRLSRLEILKSLIFQLPIKLRDQIKVESCAFSDFNFSEMRPNDCSISNAKFIRDTEYLFRPIEETCRRVVCDYFSRIY